MSLLALVLCASVSTAQMIPITSFNHQRVNGFGGDGTGWQINNNSIGSTPVTSDVLLLTDNGSFQARSAFRNAMVKWQSGFRVSFVYTVAGNRQADGMAFILQTKGTTALGGPGGTRGYDNTVTPSVAVLFDIYSGNAMSLGTNGSESNRTNISPLDLTRGNPLLVTLVYTQSTQQLRCTVLDQTTLDTFTQTFTVDIKATLSGATGYVGFSGATGGLYSTQTISNFSFTSY